MRSPSATVARAISRAALVAAAAAPVAALAVTAFDFQNPTFDYGGSAAPSQAAAAPASRLGEAPAGILEQVSASMLPSIPKPGDRVNIRVESFSTDLNAAYIVWTKDGSKVSEGRGQVTFSFTAPPAGRKTTVVMTATKANGGTVTKTFTVAPADLDILYEVDTYTPPFYQGRALFTNSARVRFVAMPAFVNPDTGAKIGAESLVYTWRVNGTVDQSLSGYGRSMAAIQGKLVSRGLVVEVDVEAPNTPLAARASIEIENATPDVAVYEDHPRYGVIFERAVDAEGAYPVGSTEITLIAVPYSLDIQSLQDARATYHWFTSAGKGPNDPLVTFRPEAGAVGVAKASVRITHENFAQLGTQAVELLFGEDSLYRDASRASTTPTGSISL